MRLRRFLRKLGLSLVVLVGVVLVLEAIARQAEPGPFSLLDRRPFVEDPKLEWVHRPGFRGRWEDTWYEINSLGLRGPELPTAERDEQFRVVALGDSCTVGKGVLEEDTWPRQLERLLVPELPADVRPAVANLGVVGYEGRQYLESLRRWGLAFRPQVVVVGYNLNDFPNTISAVEQRVYQERPLRLGIPTWLRDGLSRTALYRWARATYYERMLKKDLQQVAQVAAEAGQGVLDPATLDRQRGHIAQMAQLSREAGAEMLLLLFPFESQVYVETYDARPVEGLRAICHDLGVPFVDLAHVFREEARRTGMQRGLFVRGDRYHPSAEGYAIVARTVLETLRERGWIPKAE